jgi:hypothetical protein
MSLSEFNHLLKSIKDLSPEQLRQLRQQLDNELIAAPAPSAAGGEEQANDQKPIWEIIEEENRAIPPEVWDDLPTDLSAQHDHYIYGTPKRTDA